MDSALYVRHDGVMFRFITRATEAFTQTNSVVCENVDTGTRESFSEEFFNGHTLDADLNEVPTFRRINPDEEFDTKVGEIMRRLFIFDALRIVPDPWRLIAAAIGMEVTTSMSVEQRACVRHACMSWGNEKLDRMSDIVRDGTHAGEVEFLKTLHVLSLLRSRIGYA